MNRFVTLLWKCTRIKSWFFWRQCFIRFMILLINIWFIISDGFSAYLWLYLVSESWSSSSDNIRHLCLSQPISSSLNLWLTLTRTNQIKLKSEHSERSLAAHGWMQKNCDVFFLQLRKITSHSFDGCTGTDEILRKEFHAAFQSRASGCKAVFRLFLVF